MKKLITILIVFSVMIVAMVCEIVFVNSFYNGIQSDLEVAAESIDINKDNVNNEQTVKLCDDLLSKWEKGKHRLLMLQNHNVVRGMDDKIVSLAAVVKSDNYNDAVIFVRSAINYIDDILLDSIPYLSNIL